MENTSQFSSSEFLNDLLLNKISEHTFWPNIRKFYKENTIPDVTLFIHCLPKLYDFLKNDYASIEFYSWLEKYSQSHLKKAVSIKKEIEQNPSRVTYEFWPSVIYGLHKAGKNCESDIIKNLKSNNSFKTSASFRAATLINPKNSVDFHKLIDELIDIEKYKNYFEDIDWAYLFNFCARNLDIHEEFKKHLKELIQIESDYIYAAIARALNNQITLKDQRELYLISINQLSKAPILNANSYNSINFIFKDHYIKQPEIVSLFLEKWIDCHLPEVKNMKVLERLLNDFLNYNPKYFNLLLSKCLLKSPNHGLAVQYIISEIHITDKLHLDENWLKNLDSKVAVILSFRICGFVWDKDIAYRMMLQVLKIHVDSEEVTNNLVQLFYSEFLINYPSLIEKMKLEKTENKQYNEVIQYLVAKADEYFKLLKTLPECKEFSPSEKRLEYYHKSQFKGINLDEIDDKSAPFLNFADKTKLRAGKGFFTRIQGEFSKILEPKLISHSMEMPKLEFIDPIGQLSKRINYKHITKDELYNS